MRSSSSSGDSLKIQQENDPEKKCSNYKGIRRRKWGKWVSEIRIPGKKERLWLGSYSTPEAAAVAHDVASYCLRGPSSTRTFNFPTLSLPSSVRDDMSPKSIQKAASDAGMAVDAHSVLSRLPDNVTAANLGGSTGVIYCAPTAAEVQEEGGGGGGGHHGGLEEEGDGYGLNISVEDYL